jgi:hypothetical protein
MTSNFVKLGLGMMLVSACLLARAKEARADDAIVTVGGQRFSEPPEESPPPQSRVSTPLVLDEPRFDRDPREPHRSPFRLQLGPQGISTGKGFGVGVGVAADFGSGSVGGRLAASWLRGEGNNADGSSSPTGDAIGIYTGEVTLDLHKRGPVHPVVGMGVGLLHVSRSDSSGLAGIGTGRLGLEYSLGLEDADVRIGASVTGGLIGPVDTDVKDLRAYALVGVHLAIGF